MLIDYWAARRTYSHRALLEQRYDRLATLRDEISSNLQFEHLDKCPFEEETSRCEPTIVAVSDRYGFAIRLALCSHTGILYLIDRLTPDGYSAFYETGLYRRLIAAFRGKKDPSDRALSEENIKEAKVTAAAVVNALRQELTLTQNATLLDIGGSIGIVSEAFVRAFQVKATVLDPSERELEVAAAKGLHTKRGTIEQARFSSEEKYNVILIMQTIEHLVDIRGTFTKVHDLLDEDGYAIFDIVDFIAASAQGGCPQAASRLDHCHFMYDEMMDAFCKRVGLVIEKRIWYWRTRILFVCRKATPHQSISFPEETRHRITRELLNQYVVWFRSPRILKCSLEERIFLKLTSLLTFK